MKRERLNTAEVEMNNGALDINIWNMLKNRQEAVALINEKFGTDISVELNFAVFNEENGNAEGGETGDDEPERIDQDDQEAQVDGIKEDDASQPDATDDLEEAAEKAAEDAKEAVSEESTEGDDD